MTLEVQLPPGMVRLCEVFCGCGSPGDAWEAVHDELKRLRNNHSDCLVYVNHPDDKHWWVLAYLLDHLKLTEHGGNVSNAWLDGDGDDVLKFLDEWGDDWKEREDVNFVGADGCVWGGALTH